MLGHDLDTSFSWLPMGRSSSLAWAEIKMPAKMSAAVPYSKVSSSLLLQNFVSCVFHRWTFHLFLKYVRIFLFTIYSGWCFSCPLTPPEALGSQPWYLMHSVLAKHTPKLCAFDLYAHTVYTCSILTHVVIQSICQPWAVGGCTHQWRIEDIDNSP